MKTKWKLLGIGIFVIAVGVIMAHFIQTTDGITISQVSQTGPDGKTLRALLYVPKSATSDHKAPGVLAIHGYINSREVQSGFAIELARRGYVVLTPDQRGHGYSDGPAFADGFGGPAALELLRSLPMVDTDNIGLEGHSMGGWTVLAAAATHPDAYKSIVLVGSSTGAPFAMEGTKEWPRNVSVVYSRYDEFSTLMWGVDRAQDVGNSTKLQALFGTNAPVLTNKMYGSIAAGTARILHQPPVTHPGDHISRLAIGHAINWFDQTLEGGRALASSNQIWMAKELGTSIALVGFVLFILGVFQALLALGIYEPQPSGSSSFAYESRNLKWWGMAGFAMFFPALNFYPLFKLSEALLPASALLPQSITTQVSFWALVNGAFFALAGLFFRSNSVPYNRKIIASLKIAIATLLAAYAMVWLVHQFHLDFRIWFVGIKVLSLSQAKIVPVYLLPIGLYFILTLRALHGGLSVSSDRGWTVYASNAMIMCGGLFAFLIVQYVWLFVTGHLLSPDQPLNTIIMIQFVPILLIGSVISTYCWRRTSDILPGAFINTVLVTWILVASQATQFAG